ncbi:MAG: hypothetical protein ACYDA5_08400 [Vulcanimicrobiaceae bacterium]
MNQYTSNIYICALVAQAIVEDAVLLTLRPSAISYDVQTIHA